MPGITALRNWLFRWRSDGTAPIVLTRRRVFILPTLAGLLYAVALLVMLLGAINYSLALGHALVFLLVGLGFVGMVHTFRNLADLVIIPGRCEPVFAGETAHFILHLQNNRSQSRLALEFQSGDGPVVTTDLSGNEYLDLAIPVNSTGRGWMSLPGIRLASRYPLGLFVAWSYPQPAMRCLVFPKPLRQALPPLQPSDMAGDHSGEGGQDDFAGLRERQPADSPRHIAWKAVARDFDGRPLLVKYFAGGAQSELWLDWDCIPQTSQEERLSILTGWVLAADEAEIRFGLALPGTTISPSSGLAHRQCCLEALALFGTP